MVSDSELIERLREILSTSDLNTTTNSIVRRRLEEDFGIDLSERKVFIREQVDAYMQTQFQNEEEDDEIKEESNQSIEPEEEQEEDEGEEDESEGESSTKKRLVFNWSFLSSQLVDCISIFFFFDLIY